jgi:hypothetical protein
MEARMIAPVPGFAERPAGGNPLAPEGAAPGEGGFRELLEALAPELGKPGPEIVRLPEVAVEDLPLPEAEAPPSWDERTHSPEASKFNQHGYFATGSTEAAAVPVAQQAEAAIDPRSGGNFEPAMLMRVDAEPLPGAARTNGTVRVPASDGALPAPVTQPRTTVTSVAAPAAAAAPQSAARKSESAEHEPAAPARRFARLLEQRAASPSGANSMIEVVLREVEQGILVAGRVSALDPRERARLHDEIAGLLARHGLAARSIQISTRTATATRSQGRA